MKKFVKRVAMGAVMPAAVISSLFSFNITPKSVEPKEVGRPYVVEVFDARGKIENEFRGTSRETDPFLISQSLGANPYEEDKYSTFPEIKMGIGSKITLYRAPLINIKDGKRSKEVRSWQKTVAGLFTEQKIEIGKDDKVNFAGDTDTEDGMTIAITRVAKTTITIPEGIDYEVTKKKNPDMEKGYKKVLQKGKTGTKNKYYLVTREDGEEVSRVFTKSEIAEEPVEEIVEVGTKVVVYGSGKASWYVNTSAMIGACNLVPKGTKLHIVNTANGKSVDIVSSGGGEFSGMGRVVDLSTAAFQALGGTLGQGIIGNVRVEKWYPEE